MVGQKASFDMLIEDIIQAKPTARPYELAQVGCSKLRRHLLTLFPLRSPKPGALHSLVTIKMFLVKFGQESPTDKPDMDLVVGKADDKSRTKRV